MGRYLAAALCVLAAGSATFAQDEKQPPGRGRGGQFGRGGFGPIGASYIRDLEMKEVQEDVKMTDAEKGKLPALKETLTEGDKKFAEEMQGVAREERMEKTNARRAEVEKQVKEVLGDQFARFHQIRLQFDGLFAAVTQDKEVQEGLKITEDQRAELQEAMRNSFPRPEPGAERPSPEKMREMMEEMQKKRAEAVEKVLTADQKKKWEEMIGAKVTYKRPPMQPGGGGRRPGGKKNDAPPA
jgi:hypothetical protein